MYLSIFWLLLQFVLIVAMWKNNNHRRIHKYFYLGCSSKNRKRRYVHSAIFKNDLQILQGLGSNWISLFVRARDTDLQSFNNLWFRFVFLWFEESEYDSESDFITKNFSDRKTVLSVYWVKDGEVLNKLPIVDKQNQSYILSERIEDNEAYFSERRGDDK